MKPIIVTYFPYYTDIHLLKDPGQIPFRFQKALGYDSYIICYSGHSEIDRTKQYLKVITLPKNKIKRYIKLISFFIKNKERIKILNIFHINFHNIFVAYLCKLFVLNAFIYLKMDNCIHSGHYPWEKIFDKNIRPSIFYPQLKETFISKIKNFLIKKFLIKQVDLFSVEDKESKDYFENKYHFLKNRLIVAYNGYTVDLIEEDIKVKSFEEKENLIITVGRLGTFQKNTLNLLKGFAYTAYKHNWNLVLAGPIDPNFFADKDEFMKQHPELEYRINFVGNLGKPDLFNLYNRAKIFLLPSNYEGFANVYSEAMYFSNAIITTPYTSIKNIVKDKQLGLLIEPNNIQEIGEAILELVKNELVLKKYCINSRKFAEQELNWDLIVKKINSEIQKSSYL